MGSVVAVDGTLICDRDHCLSHRQIRNALRRTAIELR
jgi:hypothetical protein